MSTTEYKLSYTAAEINNKLAKVDENATNISQLSGEIVCITKSLEESNMIESVESVIHMAGSPLIFRYITVMYLKKSKFLTGIDVRCRTVEPKEIKVTIYVKHGDTEVVLSEDLFQANGNEDQIFSLNFTKLILENTDIYVKVETVDSSNSLFYPSAKHIQNDLIGYKNGAYDNGNFNNDLIHFSGTLYYVSLSSIEKLIDENKNINILLSDMNNNKLDKKPSSNLLNPDTFRYGYFYFNFGGNISYSESNSYGCTEPIPVNGQNIVGNSIGTANAGLASFVVFDSLGNQLRVVDGQQYTYQEGDYSVVVSYYIEGDLEFAKKTALVYGEQYIFEEYTDYLPEYKNRKKIEEVENRINDLEGITNEPISIINPSPVYSVCNDIDETRGIVNTLWIDHLIKNNSVLNKSIGFTDFYNDHICLCPPLKTEMESSKVEKELSLDIKSKFFDCSPYSRMTIKHRISKTSDSSDAFPKVLVIGDSVTDGYLANIGKLNKHYPNKYWAWCDYFFALDKLLNYDGSDEKCNYLSVGTSSFNEERYGTSDTYTIEEQAKKCYAVGKGGWSAEDLFSPNFEIESNINPFYNQESGDFSLRYFVDNFKTLEDDGKTRLVVGSTAGSKVTNVQLWDVCTPTHVVINLNHNSSLEEYKTNIPRVIEKIKQEYPDMIIILMSIDQTGTYSPAKYPDSFINTLSGLHDKNIQIYEYIRDNLVDEENGIYLCSGNLVQPPVQSYPSLDYVKAEMYGTNDIYGSKSNGGGPDWHPNNHAHSALGYQLYALIKWTMTN